MRLIPDEAGRRALYDGLERGHDRALEATKQRIRANAPRRTGEYMGSLQHSRNGAQGQVYSPLPQAGAVERGANVGPRRGPHMEGSHTMRDHGPGFIEDMHDAVRGG